MGIGATKINGILGIFYRLGGPVNDPQINPLTGSEWRNKI